jgi:hypothetical protein
MTGRCPGAYIDDIGVMMLSALFLGPKGQTKEGNGSAVMAP